MAHGTMKVSGQRLHQALHGYDGGHRKLFISTQLRPRDEKTLLSLSDSSGSGAHIPDTGYLTGYPLVESGYYALARTWSAPNMRRPGCVWTHTLLVNFTDLARIENLAGLNALFRNPSLGGTPSYAAPLPLPPAQHFPSRSNDLWLRQVLWALYASPRRQIVAPDNINAEQNVFGIWSQQWPRLRRNFRFSTFTVSDRSAEGAPFDLQVLPPGDRGLRSRFREQLYVEAAVGGDNWLDDALDDLLEPTRSGLRTFLRRVSADLTGGREAFRPLCQLYALVNADPIDVSSALRIMRDDLAGHQARSLTSAIVNAAFDAPERLDDACLNFLVDNVNLVEPNRLERSPHRFVYEVLRRDPGSLVESPEIHGLVERALDDATFEQALELIHASRLASRIMARHPDLLYDPRTWQSVEDIDLAFAAVPHQGDYVRIAGAILASRREGVAEKSVRKLGSAAVLHALATLRISSAEWTRAIAIDRNTVANFFATSPSIERQLLVNLARAIPVESLPNERGEDPWLIATQRADGNLDPNDSLFLSAYLMCRALSKRTRSAAELAQLTFEQIYTAMGSAALPKDAWKIIDESLPWSVWSSWDNCQRLIAAVAALFVEKSLSPVLFTALSTDDRVFSRIVQETARTWKGRKYLQIVARALSVDSVGALSRAEIIRRVTE